MQLGEQATPVPDSRQRARAPAHADALRSRDTPPQRARSRSSSSPTASTVSPGRCVVRVPNGLHRHRELHQPRRHHSDAGGALERRQLVNPGEHLTRRSMSKHQSLVLFARIQAIERCRCLDDGRIGRRARRPGLRRPNSLASTSPSDDMEQLRSVIGSSCFSWGWGSKRADWRC